METETPETETPRETWFADGFAFDTREQAEDELPAGTTGTHWFTDADGSSAEEEFTTGA